MRILVHDYGGYHFPLQLSRELADRGHEVMHAYCSSLQTTPPGIEEDRCPTGLQLKSIGLDEPIRKYNFLKRWMQERAYGRLVTRELLQFKPDMVLSANTPLDSQRYLLRACQKEGIRFVYWLQDLLGLAAQRILSRKLPGPGHLIGKYYVGLERRLLRESDAIITITDTFEDQLQQWGIAPDRIHVIPNWADFNAIPVMPRRNAWSEAHRLADAFCYLYAGTLGMKHNPDLLLQLALSMKSHSDVRVVVVSQGLGASWLEGQKKEYGLENLIILPYESLDTLPSILASSDVLVAILEPDAGLYSVPSKVLTYLCAGKPLLLGVPPENEAARYVDDRLGYVVSPDNAPAFIQAATQLYTQPETRLAFGKAARDYAKQTFDWDPIYAQFEKALGLGRADCSVQIADRRSPSEYKN